MKYKVINIKSAAGLVKLDTELSDYKDSEIMPYAKNTPLQEVATEVLKDKQGIKADGTFKSPLLVVYTLHPTTIGAKQLTQNIKDYLSEKKKSTYKMDIISIMAGLKEEQLCAVFIVRVYAAYNEEDAMRKIEFRDIFAFLGEQGETDDEIKEKLIIPPEAYNHYTENDIEEHERNLIVQQKAYDNASEDAPFLNSLDDYTALELEPVNEHTEFIYDLKTQDMKISTILPYDKFIEVFNECMIYITTIEKDSYYGVIKGSIEKESFFNTIEAYVDTHFINTGILPEEDFHYLKDKLERALFQLYIVQDLIDDDQITDVKITAPDSIRVRVGGKAYLSNITFINRDDYIRFINSIAVKNNVDLSVPTQTFTDESDENYILRFSITAPYITGSGLPIIHIRKVSRKKLLGPDLIKKGMFDKKIMNYLLDCGKYSKGVVFAGPPGSGKTVILNWFLECAYESNAEILVIQENDELFAYRKGVMFEHVVNNPQKGEQACSLEDLGQLALVAGANVFVIGEAKGAEICSAITLSNSGCRTAITIHSPSSTETIDKMADLAMRGYAQNYDQAKRMIKSFKTIVYMQDFKVQEISEIIGYNEKTKDIDYKCIYRRAEEDEYDEEDNE